jgi:putative ABC transport system permease protein
MSLIKLTIKSMFSRRLSSCLLIGSIALSSMLLIGVQKIKISAKQSFSQSISGTDLIVGARSGDIQLLMYTVFRQGTPVANMSWDSFKIIQNDPTIAWAVPISLGDSHRGFPVLGTTPSYFDYYRYRNYQSLEFEQGTRFSETFDVVLGADIAKQLNYELGDTLYFSHGLAQTKLPLHKQSPFRVVGILKPTGTPVDKTAHISVEGMTALHLDLSDKNHQDLTPKSITSCLIGLTSKFSLFNTQRRITNWSSEALMAIIPGVALSRLWNTISIVDHAFFIVTLFVVIIAFIGLLLALFMSLNQRKRELAILRTMGAHPIQLSYMLMLESLFITLLGVLLGIILMITVGVFLKPYLDQKLGLALSFNTISVTELYLVIGIIIFGLIISVVPAILAYRKGLSEGFISV